MAHLVFDWWKGGPRILRFTREQVRVLRGSHWWASRQFEFEFRSERILGLGGAKLCFAAGIEART